MSDDGLKWWASFLAMQGTISGLAVILSLVTDLWLVKLGDSISNLYLTSFALIMSLCMLCESFWMTYSVGGRWLHFRQQWRFFQPLQGGQSFASFQIVSWTLFFIYFLLTIEALKRPAEKIMATMDHNMISTWGLALIDGFFTRVESLNRRLGLAYVPAGSAAISGVLAELLMLVSLTLFKGPLDPHYLNEQIMLDEILNFSEQSEPSIATQSAEIEVWIVFLYAYIYIDTAP